MNINIQNRKAHHDYFILDTLECGIALRGNEVKSICNGKASIKEAWCVIQNQELILKNMHITPWETANRFDVDEKRDRRLLAHKSEIRKLTHKVAEDGITLVPLRIYYANGKIKVEIGICKGKHNYDKRNTLKQRDTERRIARYV